MVYRDIFFFSKRKSHRIKKELWKNVKPVIEKYSMSDSDDRIMKVVENNLLQIDKIDKEGDVFRYPTSYGLGYRFNDVNLDVENVYIFIKGLINFLDTCDGMLSNISDLEMETRMMYADYY